MRTSNVLLMFEPASRQSKYDSNTDSNLDSISQRHATGVMVLKVVLRSGLPRICPSVFADHLKLFANLERRDRPDSQVLARRRLGL